MAQPGFDHIVITRFSAVFRAEFERAQDDWLWSRLELFERTCLPSVAAQTAPITWLIFCDDRCPADFRERMEALSVDHFVPVWTHEPFAQACPRAVAERLTHEHLITTRLDSDDAIAIDFCERIQQEFAGQDLLYLSFPQGLQADRRGWVYRYAYRSGAFISLIERASEGENSLPRTIFGGDSRHSMARTLGPLREVQSAPMWLQIVHGANIANSVRGVRTSPEVLARFEIDLGDAPHPGLVRLRGQQVISQLSRLRLWCREPWHFLDWVDATTDRRRGSHTKPQSDELNSIARRFAHETKRRVQVTRNRRPA